MQLDTKKKEKKYELEKTLKMIVDEYPHVLIMLYVDCDVSLDIKVEEKK